MVEISVVVPVYNAEQYLAVCIESIILQKEVNIEIILVDDGSLDRSLEICEHYRKQDSRIKVIHKDNAGPHSARRMGVENAIGNYIAFVDADDWVEPDYLVSMLASIQNTGADIIITGYFEHKNDQKLICCNQIKSGLYQGDYLINAVFKRMVCCDNTFNQFLIPSMYAKLFVADIMLEVMRQIDDQIAMGEDAVCVFAYLLRINSLFIDNSNYKYHYKNYMESITYRYDKYYFAKSIKLYRCLDDLIDEHTEYLALQFDLYKGYIIYRYIPVLTRANDFAQFKEFYKCFCEAVHYREIREILDRLNVKQIKANAIQKKLLLYLKQNKMKRFYLLAQIWSLYLKQKNKKG